MSTRIKLRQCETERQARTWQELNNGAVRLGLCFTCAAQYAYGRQHGWRQVKPPCSGCLGIAYALCPTWPLAFAGTATSAVHGSTPTGLPAMPATGARALPARRPEAVAA